MPEKTTTVSIEVGKKMRHEREAVGISIREVARRMAGDNEKRYDTYRRYIIRWENGHNTPDESNRNAYADAVGCPRSLFQTFLPGAHRPFLRRPSRGAGCKGCVWFSWQHLGKDREAAS